MSYVLRFDGAITSAYLKQFIIFASFASCLGVGCMTSLKLYHHLWRYAGIEELLSAGKALLIGGIIAYLITFTIDGKLVPMSIWLGSLQSMFLLLGGYRFSWKLIQYNFNHKAKKHHNALIIGAGDCGTMIAKELKYNRSSDMYPVAFIDDAPLKHDSRIHGVPIIGGRQLIGHTVEKFAVDDIIIAMPSVSKREISEIVSMCKCTKAKLKIMPHLNDLINGKVTVNQIRDVEVEDLLGREPIKVDLDGIANYVEGKTVLITGAGGSIGSEMCRQIAPFKPARLMLLGHGENSIYTIEMELRRKFPDLVLETVIADIQDAARMDDVFCKSRPHVVFHAAAHKHVPLMERNPTEAIKNNVFGTKNVAECADRYQAERFVLISTDKAVNPTSVMGATKRVAEMFIQCLDKTSATKFVAVRFGNVLGSRGSVIPFFKQQIAMGGPVTVTHPDMIRYFMTIPEAVQLVIQAGSFAQGGEIFILDMGKPVKIVDLAKDLIKLSGFEPGVDIDIQYTGIRPGEKLFEELLTDEEGITSTLHDRIFIGKPMNINRYDLDFEMKKLEKMIGENPDIIRNMLGHIVPSFQTETVKPSKKEVSLV